MSGSTVTAAGSETHTFNLVNPAYGTILVHQKTPSNQSLPGACFGVRPASDRRVPLFQACDDNDGHDDGSTTLHVPAGNVDLVEYQAPAGYVTADPVPLQVTSAQTTETTVTDPTPSTLIIHAVEGWGAPKPGLCWTWVLSPAISSGWACDVDDGANDGVTHITGLQYGTYSLSLFDGVPTGYKDPATSGITLGVMTTKNVTITLKLTAKPKLTRGPIVNNVSATTVDLFFESDQPTHGRIDFGTTDALGGSAAGKSAYVPSQTITVTGLLPGSLYSFRIHVENQNGQAESEIFQVRTGPADASATLIVKTVSPR